MYPDAVDCFIDFRTFVMRGEHMDLQITIPATEGNRLIEDERWNRITFPPRQRRSCY
jgi:hypothetical protein